jgi:hypothetical protein
MKQFAKSKQCGHGRPGGAAVVQIRWPVRLTAREKKHKTLLVTAHLSPSNSTNCCDGYSLIRQHASSSVPAAVVASGYCTVLHVGAWGSSKAVQHTTSAMSFRFASAVSQHPSLYQAIADVVTQTKAQLGGRLPDFCQLLVTKAHSRNVDHAPKVWYQATASRRRPHCSQQPLQLQM